MNIRRQNLRRLKRRIFDFYQTTQKKSAMRKRRVDELKQSEQTGPPDAHVELLRMWVQIAGEADGPACAEAWATVVRLSHALALRASRHHKDAGGAPNRN